MKKSLFIVLFLSAALTAYGFSTVLTYLKGHAETDAIVLEWQSGSEEGVKSYTIERAEVNSTDFKELSTLTSTGNNSSYRYRDVAINSMVQSGGVANNPKVPLADLFKYRLKMNYDKEVVSYSQTISVTRPSSGVKRTWGMIKEMFR